MGLPLRGQLRTSPGARSVESSAVARNQSRPVPPAVSSDPSTAVTLGPEGLDFDLAVGNFVEMRDKTASRIFRAKKKLDHLLEAALPGMYLPLYTMVTFSRVPYAQAARRARLQDRIIYSIFAALTLVLLFVFIRIFR